MSRLRNLICFIALLSSTIETARILAVFPTPSISHQVVFRPLTHELARRGHEVVVITTDPAFPKGQTPDNLTEIDVQDVSYEALRKIMAATESGHDSALRKQVDDITRLCLGIFEKQTAVPEVIDIIKNKKYTFDLLLVEAWPRFALAFSHVLKVPVVAVSSFGAVLDNYQVMGAPIHYFLYPQALNTRLYHLTLWEKIIQFCKINFILKQFQYLEVNENIVVKRIFGEDTPPLSELQNKIDLMFLNIHPIWEGNRPVPPSVIHIGGMHQKPQKELPQDLKQYLDSSVHGVIYLSFGTNVDTTTIPVEKIQIIIKVFSQLPYDVLWKWNHDELPGRSKNIRISKWFPQSDLVRHPKVKLFVTQGGLQSTDETIKAGVPVIGIPMMADQWYNVEKYEHHNIGKKILLSDLVEETFRSAIKTVIEDKSYRDNIVRLRTLMYDQPMTSLERAVWWTEHVLRHGGARHLRAPAANMPWTEYYEIKLILTLFSIALIVVVLSLLVLYKIVRLIFRYAFSSSKIKVS